MSREIEFFTEKELEMQIGHDRGFWRVAILKELIDNALDACEVGEISPELEIDVTDEYLQVIDNGPGITQKLIKKSLNYFTRISDKQFYVSPTRGQMGNALKTVWAAPFVDTGEGKAIIESKGYRHTVETSLDRISQKPEIDYKHEKTGLVKTGTSFKVMWRNSSRKETANSYDFYKVKAPTVEELICGYSAFNPHTTFKYGGKVHEATERQWKKWRTDMPTSAHWYDNFRLRDLIAAYVNQERSNGQKPRTVREFVSEFRGLSSTVKQKQITESFSGVYLHDLVQDSDINIDFVQNLLQAMKSQSNPIKPVSLGLIGEEHFKTWIKQNEEVIEESFRYAKRVGVEEKTGFPYIFETAFAVKKNEEARRTINTGLNWTPTLGIPAAEISEAISKCRIDHHDPVILIIHIAKPRFEYVDRGKTRMSL